jgi:hypothetical protein
MQTLIRHITVPIWLVLVGATALSWWLGTDGGTNGSGDHTWPTVSLMIVAFFKVRLVGIHFMELGHAPWPLRMIFEAWVAIVCGVVLGLYLTLKP